MCTQNGLKLEFNFAVFYAHALRDRRGHTHTHVTTFTRSTQNCIIGSLVDVVWLCMLGIESSCTVWLFQKKKTSKSQEWVVCTLKEMPDFCFCLVCGSLKKKTWAKLWRWLMPTFLCSVSLLIFYCQIRSTTTITKLLYRAWNTLCIHKFLGWIVGIYSQ